MEKSKTKQLLIPLSYGGALSFSISIAMNRILTTFFLFACVWMEKDFWISQRLRNEFKLQRANSNFVAHVTQWCITMPWNPLQWHRRLHRSSKWPSLSVGLVVYYFSRVSASTVSQATIQICLRLLLICQWKTREPIHAHRVNKFHARNVGSDHRSTAECRCSSIFLHFMINERNALRFVSEVTVKL